VQLLADCIFLIEKKHLIEISFAVDWPGYETDSGFKSNLYKSQENFYFQA